MELEIQTKKIPTLNPHLIEQIKSSGFTPLHNNGNSQQGDVYLSGDYLEKLFIAIEASAPINTALKFANIPKKVYASWQVKATIGRLPYVDIIDKVSTLQASVEIDMLNNIKEAGKKDWKASKWRLETLDRNNYGAVDTLVHTNELELSIARLIEQGILTREDMGKMAPSLVDRYFLESGDVVEGEYAEVDYNV